MLTRYPRPGRPLVPASLRELFLRSKVPFLNKEGKQELFAHLDRGCWDRFTNAQCEDLGKMVVQRLQGRLSTFPEELKSRRLPPSPAGLILDDLALEPRTMNALTKCGYRERMEDLEQLTLGDLLELPSFGARCMIDLLTILESLAILGWEPEGVAPLPEPVVPKEPAAASPRRKIAAPAGLPAPSPEGDPSPGLPEVPVRDPFERLALAMSAHGGAVHIEDFVTKLAGRIGVGVTLERTRKNLEDLDGLEWLDEEKAWFWIPRAVLGNAGLIHYLVKLLPEAGERNLDSLYVMLKEVPELRGAMPPEGVFRKLCARLPAVPLKRPRKAKTAKRSGGTGTKRGPRRKVLLAAGELEDGRFHMKMCISPSMLKNGIFSMPTAFVGKVEGRFPIFGENGRQAGTLALQRPTSWGLRTFLRSLEAGEGDVLDLRIDPKLGRVEARLERAATGEDSGVALAAPTGETG